MDKSGNYGKLLTFEQGIKEKSRCPFILVCVQRVEITVTAQF